MDCHWLRPNGESNYWLKLVVRIAILRIMRPTRQLLADALPHQRCFDAQKTMDAIVQPEVFGKIKVPVDALLLQGKRESG
jgi:hypothetical protein